MPPEGNGLSAATVADFRHWIDTGAAWSASVGTLSAARVITAADREFWSFAALKDPVPSADPHDRWSRGDLDRFIWGSLRAAGLAPLPQADRPTLLRRLYFDLIGLPPTPAEVRAFVADASHDAFARRVGQLLDRPEYGQRWARHWLDLVRFAESDGFKADVYRPHAWRYRDYVIRSLNADKPYDRFLQEQLAGDELFPDDPQSRIATGYLRLWPLEDNQKDVQRQWKLILQDVTEVTAEVMLGMGLRCARCHDHKYDPISQADYYRMQAFFAGMLPRDDLEVPLQENQDADKFRSWEQDTHELRHAMRQMISQHVASRKDTIKAYPDYLQTLFDTPLARWSPAQRQMAYLARPQVEKRSAEKIEFKGPMRRRWNQLSSAMQRHSPRKPSDVAAVMAVTDVGVEAAPTFIGNDPRQSEVAPGFLSVLAPGAAEIIAVSVDESTGRRATLARWLTQPEHPLTARVIVNRVWQQHFGRGIVGTSNDFGRQGERPSHPELLDWLARRFVEDGWSLKQLHRRIVLSATYQQASRHEAEITGDAVAAERMFHGHATRPAGR